MVFYHTINTDEPAYNTLFTENEYAGFVDRIRNGFFSSDFFMNFCKSDEDRLIVPAYIGSVAMGTYRVWHESDNGREHTLDQLADSTADLIMNGLKMNT